MQNITPLLLQGDEANGENVYDHLNVVRKPEDFVKGNGFNLSSLVDSDKLGTDMIQMGHKNNLEEPDNFFYNLVSIFI